MTGGAAFDGAVSSNGTKSIHCSSCPLAGDREGDREGNRSVRDQRPARPSTSDLSPPSSFASQRWTPLAMVLGRCHAADRASHSEPEDRRRRTKCRTHFDRQRTRCVGGGRGATYVGLPIPPACPLPAARFHCALVVLIMTHSVQSIRTRTL